MCSEFDCGCSPTSGNCHSLEVLDLMPPDDDDNQMPADSGDELVEGTVDDSELDEMFAGLNHQQSHAVMALMSEASIDRAASRAGVSTRTLHRWMTQVDFQRAYRLARRQAFQQATTIVVKYAPVAVSTLVRILSDRDAPPHAQVTAAGLLLRFGRESIQLDDVMARVDALEAALSSNRKSVAPGGNGAPADHWRPLT